ncbi:MULTISPECIES: hypothetical protein [Oceanobacillus]|uniref:hypothetical protein n=1 Tax=Oceanobacillus TaxID=182709 RepID=UPI0009849117|nr:MULTISPECIES: hypothetical protein [Oceanobacillus]MBT2599366.1 hypothetical protein [Oceanobacillus sp. ISL-74]MBT2652284.1 hypothetical protein [Oceanobacillus sp. ISL-73]
MGAFGPGSMECLHGLSTADPGSNVKVSIEQGESELGYSSGAKLNWTMELQRYESGRWNTIGTRTR